MKRTTDIAGQVFGNWTAIEPAGQSSGKARIALWKCKCLCGAVAVVYGTALRSGNSTGCLECAKSKISAARKTHGMTKGPTWLSWKSMKARCSNRNNPDFAQYGGRGILVCERWQDFEAFVADMGVRPAGMTLERENTNGNYEPGNCRWATPVDQANNRRSNTLVSWNGESMSMSEFGRRIGMDRRMVRYHLVIKGLSPDDVAKEAGYGKVSGAC